MAGLEKLDIKDPAKLYQELASFLPKYKDEPVGSHLFVVEGTVERPLVALRYPGRKMVKRIYKTKSKPKNFIEWANLLDFEVVAFDAHGAEVPKSEFTYKKLFDDFAAHKIHDEAFCRLLDEMYERNTMTGSVPKTTGIESKQFLLMLKWMWIQEDVNYKYSHHELGSPIPYRLQTLKGSPTSNGAGRARFYASLYLLRSGKFPAAIVPKIIGSR